MLSGSRVEPLQVGAAGELRKVSESDASAGKRRSRA